MIKGDTMSKKYRVFKNLSLKEPQLKTKAKMEQTNINTSKDSDIKPTEIPKPAVNTLTSAGLLRQKYFI